MCLTTKRFPYLRCSQGEIFLELVAIQRLWERCRWIEAPLLRPQGLQKPISFKPKLGERKLTNDVRNRFY